MKIETLFSVTICDSLENNTTFDYLFKLNLTDRANPPLNFRLDWSRNWFQSQISSETDNNKKQHVAILVTL